jgi:hypothetical protein
MLLAGKFCGLEIVASRAALGYVSLFDAVIPEITFERLL